ncbi:BON domain-containing protein [Variovorax dokdonensis]|uniref:BON domain-containing protein n=1 Tax=Variovorax dokdonensis TaxID=344883 RepID=A0ABT7NG84_9BURK|nr:BON domain-containing protein [Variovorax dokdonensis]MDM0046949.1 BON domain-containing protein [Variovorax dokdonensis]
MKKKAAFVAQRSIITLAAGAALALALGGCVPLVVGGAAVGAGMVATDRRSSGAQLDDTNIEVRGAARIRDIANDNMNVTVISFNRQVLLTGTVASEADRRRAEEVVSQVDNVRKVYNEVVVGTGSSIMDRSNDTYITSKVKAQLVSQSDIFANNFKVVTERGVVYLMGIATRAETDRATEIARSVDGVQKVVRIVEIVSASELGTTTGGTGAAPAGSSSSSVPLPPMAPLPPAGTPAGGGATTSPVR